ncbi:MAG: c-type cytochrome [Planctomycetes bacterium]|nr:c-type cytochrome [Planctomycetota bacterium]
MKLLTAGLGLTAALTVVIVLANCSAEPAGPKLSDLAEKGRRVYSLNCTVCHGADPHVAGAQGPEIAGASLELLTARVLHATYPEGYKPKRDTKQMVALPYLQDALPALEAYLREVPPSQ